MLTNVHEYDDQIDISYNVKSDFYSPLAKTAYLKIVQIVFD